MAALAGDSKTDFFKDADRVLLADSRNLGHGGSNGDEFGGDFAVVLRGLMPDILFGDLQPEFDGFADVGQSFLPG